MAETVTDRFGLVQWSSGGDSPSRLDFNEALLRIEQRAAIDPGVTYSALPATFLTGGRYALVVPPGDESAYRTLYRRNDSASWDFAGGNAVRAPFHFRANGQARTDAAVTLSHPDFAAAGGTLGYDGSALLTGTVRVHDAADAARGAMLIGTDAAPSLATLGRLHVRTRATAERGIVVQPYTPGEGDAGSGNLITARTAGGSDVLYVDALGRFRTVAAASFGGGALAAQHSVVLAPTTNPVDGNTNGLLLHGQAAATSKAILTVQRDTTADTTPIAQFLRDGIGLGRLPWGTPGGGDSSSMTFSANTVHFRTSGNVANTSYWNWRRSDPTSPATEANPALDTTLMSVGPNGIGSGLPMFVSQRYKTNLATMSLYRLTDFNASFLDLGRLVPNGGGGEDLTIVSSWQADGRLRTGAPWRGMGTVRDARQAVTHYSRKWFALPSDPVTTALYLDTGQTYTYTWAPMTVRSSTTTDLAVTLGMEVILIPLSLPDTNDLLIETLVSVNGSAYVVADTTHYTAPVQQDAARLGGDLLSFAHRITGVATGATFTLQTRFTVGTSIPDFRVRMLDISATETLLEQYAAA